MDNASKAMLMAGGMLLGIAILGLFAYLFRSGIGLGKSYDARMEREEVQAFNSEIEKYTQKKEISAQDIVSLANFVYNNNIKNENNTGASITLEVKKDGATAYKIVPSDTMQPNCFLNNMNQPETFSTFLKEYTKSKTETDPATGIKTSKYQYKIELFDIFYNKSTGRINKIIYRILDN